MKKYWGKLFEIEIMQWIAAAVVAGLLVNLLCFAYERPVGVLYTTSAITEAVRKPNTILVHGTEGYGITVIDENGFTNPDLELADEYILIMGASHSQGKEIASDKKYSVLLNDYLMQGKEEKLYVYNAAYDGNFLPRLINNFNAGIQQFPDSEMVVLEISSTDYSVEELSESLAWLDFDETQTAEYLFGNASLITKIKQQFKECFPFLYLIRTKLEAAEQSAENNAAEASEEEATIDETEYEAVINTVLYNMRSVYDGTMVFVYHPSVSLQYDGELICNQSQTLEIFKAACEQNEIDFIDLSDAFLAQYESSYELPYGFTNTQLGSGHLNEVGHQLFADALIEFIEGKSA